MALLSLVVVVALLLLFLSLIRTDEELTIRMDSIQFRVEGGGPQKREIVSDENKSTMENLANNKTLFLSFFRIRHCDTRLEKKKHASTVGHTETEVMASIVEVYRSSS